MKKKFILLGTCALFALSSCGENTTSSSNTGEKDETVNYALPQMIQLLRGDLNTNEISSSNKVIYSETTTKEGVSVETRNETWNIYNGQVSDAKGERKITYDQSDTVVNDTYEQIVKVATYGTNKVIYYVTDYADGTKNSSWVDSANKLSVLDEGDGTEEGYTYILSSSVPSQLSKQVAMIASNYIVSNFTGNAYTSSSYPTGYRKTENGVKTYYINPFSYSYTDDDILTSITDEFSFTVIDNKIVSFKTSYSITYSRDDTSYKNTYENEYTLSYEDREDAPSSLINPELYFLLMVTSAQAYYYEDNKEVAVDLDKLPTKKYIHFKASNYAPAKAVDLNLYPESSEASSNPDVVSIDSIYFYTEKAGKSTLSLMGMYGASISVEVTVLPPEIKSMTYSDTYSDIEKVYDGLNVTRYVYSNTTYTGIRITPNPTDADKEDVEVSVDNESMVKITATNNTNTIDYTFEVLDVNEGDSFTVTFASKTKPEIKTSMTYYCKKKAANNEEEINAFLKSHTYTWSGDVYNPDARATVTFLDNNKGKIVYTWSATFSEEVEFTYTLSGFNAAITITSEDPYYDFDTLKLTMDLKQASFTVKADADFAYKTLTFNLDE